LLSQKLKFWESLKGMIKRNHSRLSSGILVVKGISLIRRQIPWSVPLMTGLWFEKKLLPPGRNNQKMKILKVGTKLKYSPYRNLAVKASFPVTCLIRCCESRFPCSVSEVVTNRAFTTYIFLPICRVFAGGNLAVYVIDTRKHSSWQVFSLFHAVYNIPDWFIME
jgi:hypothetical protein